MEPLTEGQRVSALRVVARRSIGVFVGCGLVSLVLQVVGCFTMGWMVMEVGDASVHVGLWAVKSCFSGQCQTIDNSAMYGLELGTYGFRQYRVETILALVLMVTFLIVLPSCVFCQSPGASIQIGVWSSFLTTLISGGLAILASGKFGNQVRQAGELTKGLTEENMMKPPYSVIVTGMGGLLAVILALGMLLHLKPWRREFESQPQFVMCPASNYAINQAPLPATHQPSFPGQDPGLSSDPYRAGY